MILEKPIRLLENVKNAIENFNMEKEQTYILNYPCYFQTIPNGNADPFGLVKCKWPIIKNIRFIKDFNDSNPLFKAYGYYLFDLFDDSEKNLRCPGSNDLKAIEYFIKNTKKNLKILMKLEKLKIEQVELEQKLERYGNDK